MTFLHDAEYKTESWRRRHSPEAIKQLGVWRWKGIQDNAAMILNEICGKRVIDFGGAGGPLGFGSEIWDLETANPTELQSLKGIYDVVFTSHTLEHVGSLSETLTDIGNLLNFFGSVIVHVPSYTCTRWRHCEYNNPNQYTLHYRTFTIGNKSEYHTDIVQELVSGGFNIEFAEYVGDDSILILARKA